MTQQYETYARRPDEPPPRKPRVESDPLEALLAELRVLALTFWLRKAECK